MIKKSDFEVFGGLRFCLVLFLIIILAATGWVKNIIRLSELDFERPHRAEVIRIVGIIPPVGAIIGWVNIEDKTPADTMRE